MIIKEYLNNHRLIYSVLAVLANSIFIISRKIYKRNLTDGVLLVISMHKLGDTVFTIPALTALIQNTKSKVIIFCFKNSEVIYKSVYKNNQNIIYETLRSEEMLWNGRIIPGSIKKQLFKKYSLSTILDLTGGIISASLLLKAKTKNIVGCNESLYKSLYDKFQLLRNTPHLIEMYFDSVKLLFPTVESTRYKYYPASYNPNDPIMIHPFAGWQAKEWNLEKFIKLSLSLSKIHKVKIILPNNSLDEESLNRIRNEQVDFVQSKNIEALITVLKNCSLLISNDSGPVQIASLLGKPTFSIYGPTSPEYSVPFGTHHNYIQKKISCSPVLDKQYCYTDAGRNGCKSFECMNLLSEAEVFFAVKKFMKDLKFANFSETNPADRV